MESKGRKGRAYTIRSWNVTLNTKAGCVHSKRTSKKHCVNGVTVQLMYGRECAKIALKKREAQAKQSMWKASDTMNFGIFWIAWGVDYMYPVCQIEWEKKSPWKNLICPWKVLEKKGLRSVRTMSLQIRCYSAPWYLNCLFFCSASRALTLKGELFSFLRLPLVCCAEERKGHRRPKVQTINFRPNRKIKRK